MANISITFNTTAAQDKKLAKVLDIVNSERATRQEDPFADTEEYFRFIIIETVKAYVKKQGEDEALEVAKAYDEASNSVKDQVEALLGLSL